MQWLFDHENRRYLDMFAGIVTVSVGHCHPHVTAAAHAQLDRLWHTTNIYLHPKIHAYAEMLAARLPGDLKVVYFVNSGSEANDMAMLLARLYTGSFDIIALRNAYHGMSPYTMGLTNLSTWKYNVPHGFGVHHSVNADPYRGLFGGQHCRDSPSQVQGRPCACKRDGECEAGKMYVKQLRDLIAHSTPGRIAGFFAESIQGVGGTVQFPRGFLKGAFEAVRESGGVCISDEVQTGFGRLGSHRWGFETHGVVPDIVTMAKGIGCARTRRRPHAPRSVPASADADADRVGSNGFPLAAVVTTPAIAQVMKQRLHFNTFGGNPIASAVGIATLETMEREKTQENCARVGAHLFSRLAALQTRHAVIGDVRGKGLMVGIELVRNRDTREPATAETAAVFERLKELGVLVGKGGLYGNVLRIKPPMCITVADVDFFAACLDRALTELHVE